MLGPFGPIYQPVLAILETQINTTIPQTNSISTIEQLINAVSQFLQMCKNIRITFLIETHREVGADPESQFISVTILLLV